MNEPLLRAAPSFTVNFGGIFHGSFPEDVAILVEMEVDRLLKSQNQWAYATPHALTGLGVKFFAGCNLDHKAD